MRRVPYHYEDIPARGDAERFRVGDRDDEVVKSFATENEARDFVRAANASYWTDMPPSWRF